MLQTEYELLYYRYAHVCLFQIEAHQMRLESLREEKHRLFQQLKMVLHEEDERKRLKEEEQKQ